MYSVSTLNTMTEVPLNKAPKPQLLPGRRSINGCPLLRVCVHGVCVCVCVCSLLCVYTLDELNAEHKIRVWVTILGRMLLRIFSNLIKKSYYFKYSCSKWANIFSHMFNIF